MTASTYREKPYRPRRRLKKGWKIAIGILSVLLSASIIYTGILVARHLRVANTPGAKVETPDWVEEDLLPVNEWSRPGTPLEEINGVVIHYVGNPNTSAKANRSFFANLALTHETYASSHYIVGLEGEIIQCVPLSEISYCSNDRNRDTIAIEVCHEDDTGVFSAQTQESVETLTAWLCVQFDLDSSQVISHYDVSGKICPKYYVENEDAWADLLAGVDARIPTFAQ